MAGRSCSACAGRVRLDSLPVSIRRQGRIVYRLKVPAWRCTACGQLEIDEAVRESVVVDIERHSQPGDDVILPLDPEGQ